MSPRQLTLLRANYAPRSQALEKGDLVKEVLDLEATSMTEASGLMLEFAAQTGLKEGRPRRYLWTDAFAVCNFIDLYFKSNHEEFRAQAVTLIDQVHSTLGRHRVDDHKSRKGWISGFSEVEGAAHPTSNGLRIGKPLPERDDKDEYDDDDEWDRDGQYYHYATKWMQALIVASQKLANPMYLTLAYEMARGIHPKFVKGGRMYWKMSIDLSKPQVYSMGHHDPLDGYLTYTFIEILRAKFASTLPSLSDEIGTLRAIMKGKDWTTDDSLGLGGILCDIYRAFHLFLLSNNDTELFNLTISLLRAAKGGLSRLLRKDRFDAPASRRLAFRELGLSIGLRAVAKLNVELLNDSIASRLPDKDLKPLLDAIAEILQHQALVSTIESFWLRDASQRANTWTGHLDINMVMLATSLSPDAFLNFE